MRTWTRSTLVSWLTCGARALGFALVSGLLVAACDEARRASDRDPRGAPTEEVPSTQGPAGGDPGARAAGGDPGARAAGGDAASGEDAACVARLRASLPRELGLLLEDLGYDSALIEACASERAARVGDEAACEGLSAAGLRAGCRRRLAVAHARPDACPRVLDLGREPTCLAWAARDPARCAAALGSDALVCRAPFERNTELCRELQADLPRCESAVARYAELLAGSRPGALPPVEGELQVSFSAAEPEPPAAEGDARVVEPALEQPTDLSLARGVYIAREGCVATLHLASSRNTIAHPRVVGVAPLRVRLGALRAPLRDARLLADAVQIGLRPVVGAPAVQPRPADDAQAPVGAPLASVRGEVLVHRVEPERGGEVRLELDLHVPALGGTYRVHGQLASFVRDLDPLPAACATQDGAGEPEARERGE